MSSQGSLRLCFLQDGGVFLRRSCFYGVFVRHFYRRKSVRLNIRLYPKFVEKQVINEEDGNFSSTIKVSTYQCDNIIRQSFLGIIKIKKSFFVLMVEGI